MLSNIFLFHLCVNFYEIRLLVISVIYTFLCHLISNISDFSKLLHKCNKMMKFSKFSTE